MRNKKWIIYPKKSDNIIEQLLINRKIDLKDKEVFLYPNYERDLYNPYLFEDMDKAVKRIIKAINNKEKIGIFTDYDADGIPGGALLFNFLKFLDADLNVYIPKREEGYGLNKSGLNELSRNGCKLIITVDLGVANGSEIDYAKKSGINVIVTDHHEIQKNKFPKNAYAIIHPNLPGQKYPNKFLAGGGVAWKLCQGIISKIKDTHSTSSGQENKKLKNMEKWLLDLAAISTITDMVPLLGENRVIAKYGLIVLKKTRNLGLQKLYQVAEIKKDLIDTYTVGFQIGPRINAPGRMDHASPSFYLLTSENESEVLEIARKLNKLNQNRQNELKRVLTEAREKIKKNGFDKKKIIIVEDKNWPAGVVGLVAGKIMEEFSRPTIILGEHEGDLKGSGRSIGKFHLFDALSKCQKCLISFGGHAKAAGLSLERKHLSNLYDLLLKIAESKISDEDLVPKIKIDLEIDQDDLTIELFNKLKKFEPFGFGNPRPVFLAKGLIINNIRSIGKEGKHLKLNLQPNLDAIGFDMGNLYDKIKSGDNIDVVFTLDLNEWNGSRKLQLKIMDLKNAK